MSYYPVNYDPYSVNCSVPRNSVVYGNLKNMFFLDETFTNLLDSTPYLNNNAAANASIQSQLCSYRTTAIKNSQQVETSTLMLTTPGASYTLKPPILSPSSFTMYQAAPSAITTLGNLNLGGFQGAQTTNVPSGSNSVYTIAQDLSNNCIYVGGSFFYIGQTIVNGIAKWDRSSQTWSALGGGFGGTSLPGSSSNVVYSIVLDSSRQLLYVAGSFSFMYNGLVSVPTSQNFAIYNLATGVWTGPTAIISSVFTNTNTIFTLKLDPTNTYLYVGGLLTISGSTPTLNNLIRFTSLGATPARDATFNINLYMNFYTSNSISSIAPAIYSLEYDLSNNVIYVGGLFNTLSSYTVASATTTLDVSANNILGFSLTTNLPIFLSNGTNGTVSAIKLNPLSNNLYVGGTFTNVNNIQYTSGIASWNTASLSWSALSSGVSNQVLSFDIDYSNKLLFVGGNMTTVGGKACGGIAIWDYYNSIWISNSLLGVNGSGSQVFRSLAFFQSTNQLYMGINITATSQFQGSTLINGISVWNRNNTIKIYDQNGLPFYESCIYKDHPRIAYYNGNYII